MQVPSMGTPNILLLLTQLPNLTFTQMTRSSSTSSKRM